MLLMSVWCCACSAWAGSLCLWNGWSGTWWSRDIRWIRRPRQWTTGALPPTTVRHQHIISTYRSLITLRARI